MWGFDDEINYDDYLTINHRIMQLCILKFPFVLKYMARSILSLFLFLHLASKSCYFLGSPLAPAPLPPLTGSCAMQSSYLNSCLPLVCLVSLLLLSLLLLFPSNPPPLSPLLVPLWHLLQLTLHSIVILDTNFYTELF